MVRVNAILLAAALLMGGCATAGKINGVQLGMTKQEVIRVMGKPVSVSAKGESEYLNYALAETDDDAMRGVARPYFVRLVNGKVDSYGRTGDFDSTKTPTVRLESDQTVTQTGGVGPDLYTELTKLKELKDAGVISQAEFDAQKKKLLGSR